MSSAGLLLAGLASVAGMTALVRRKAMRWGAHEAEARAALPGDDLVPDAAVQSTRAITVRAPSEHVWPWLVQIGQDRGGFYSYDWLENLIGLDVRSANRVEARWQRLAVGDAVRLAPQMPLTVAEVDPPRTLVLLGAAAEAPFRFTWSFVIRDGAPGTVRLVARERYGSTSVAGRLFAEAVCAVSMVMSARMLRGIRDRAQSQLSA